MFKKKSVDVHSTNHRHPCSPAEVRVDGTLAKAQGWGLRTQESQQYHPGWEACLSQLSCSPFEKSHCHPLVELLTFQVHVVVTNCHKLKWLQTTQVCYLTALEVKSKMSPAGARKMSIGPCSFWKSPRKISSLTFLVCRVCSCSWTCSHIPPIYVSVFTSLDSWSPPTGPLF